MTGQTVTVRKLLPASCEEVFDAWLDAETMSEWMRPAPSMTCDVALDPRVGGKFRIVMKAPHAEFVNIGEFLVLDRPSRLQFTWISSRWGNQETLVTVELHRLGTRCELVLTHDRFPMEHSSEQLVNGWNQMLEKLANRFGFPPLEG